VGFERPWVAAARNTNGGLNFFSFFYGTTVGKEKAEGRASDADAMPRDTTHKK
jgi:hypothetical protein